MQISVSFSGSALVGSGFYFVLLFSFCLCMYLSNAK